MFEGWTEGQPEDIPGDCQGPVWILGKSYGGVRDLEAIRDDVQSRLWFTYRRCFAPVGTPQLTTDKGWGCMVRVGQMILAQTLVQLHLGRDWRWTKETRDPKYLKIVNLFEDNRKSGFSLRQIALMGHSEDKKVGQWFGPNTVAQVLKKLLQYEEWCNLNIHVAMDNMVVIEDILEQHEDPVTKAFTPLLLMVNLRLGIHEINPIYLESLRGLFEVPGCVGMIGGRPNQALYFFGYAGEEALCLDPHITQTAGTVGQKLEEEEIQVDGTYHQRYAVRLAFRQMDPSMAVGFLARTRQEFDQLCDRLNAMFSLDGRQALFEISRQRLAPWDTADSRRGRSDLGGHAFALDDDEEEQGLEGATGGGPSNSEDEFEIIA